MLTRPQPHEAEAVTHEAEARTHEAEAKTHEAEAKAEARFSASRPRSNSRPSSWGGRSMKNRKICNGSLIKTRKHVQNVRNWVNYRTKIKN